MTDILDLKNIRHWGMVAGIVIKETPYFTKIIQQLMPDDLYAELQHAIIRRPDVGDIIPGSGGLRKVRWKMPRSGKRGGVRVIYYWIAQDSEIYMIYAYAKAKCEDLTKQQIGLLRQVIQEELNNG